MIFLKLVEMNELNKEYIQSVLDICYKICCQFSWLTEAYVLDFFTENHWQKLPNSWKHFLSDVTPEEMGSIIDLKKNSHCKKLMPLSLLCLQILVKKWHLSREQQPVRDISYPPNGITGLMFTKELANKSKIWKHVKPKKRHEIELMAKVCYETALKCNCFCVVDIGSGLGHLSRLLSFGYGFKVCGIEVQEKLTQQARYLDIQFERTARKFYSNSLENNIRPVHVNMNIESPDDVSKILEIFKKSFDMDKSEVRFGIVGLHPCGNLGSNLLHFFKTCPNIQFINIVSCCYMKTTEYVGHPLSNYCIERKYSLSYYSREIACHALETYVNRLRAGQYWQLKIHSFRAAIEKLIIRRWPSLKHSPLNNVKYTENLTFSEYCVKALHKRHLKLNITDSEIEEIEECLLQWKSVVMFYSLRLLLAPLLETIILLDRILFTIENGADASIGAVFDPLLSPRNHILTALKQK